MLTYGRRQHNLPIRISEWEDYAVLSSLCGIVESAVNALHLLFRVHIIAGNDSLGQRRVRLESHLIDTQDLLRRKLFGFVPEIGDNDLRDGTVYRDGHGVMAGGSQNGVELLVDPVEGFNVGNAGAVTRDVLFQCGNILRRPIPRGKTGTAHVG